MQSLERLLIQQTLPMEEIISDFARFNAAIDRLMEIGFTDEVATELVAKLWEPPFAV